MTKMSYATLKSVFCRYEEGYPQRHLTAYIVFKRDNCDRLYSLKSRTYEVSSGNKAFQPNDCGYSILGTNLNMTDRDVRLEAYMADELGGDNGWEIDYCYIA